jgi:hypothetical protein
MIEMQELKGKLFHLILIAFLVIIILFSNLGQNFKTDIFSYSNTLSYSNTFTDLWNKHNDSQDYIASSSDYLVTFLKNNNIKPLLNSNYVEEFPISIPNFKYPSSLEIISRYGRIIKKFQYGVDFTEDFKGYVTSGVIKGKANYIDNINSNEEVTDVILYDGYSNKNDNEITTIDSKIIESGISGVISPAYSYDLSYESGSYSNNLKQTDKGLVKFIVTPSTFSELKKFANRGYIIRLKSGAEIKPTKYRNIYGILNGKKNLYKPLILVSFYDGIYKTPNQSKEEFQKYIMNTSVMLESIRGINSQRISEPDRPIIVAFLSGYSYDKEGLNTLFNKNLNGDIVILDGLGLGDRKILSYSKIAKPLSNTIEHFIKQNDFEIISKNLDLQSDKSFVYILSNSFENPVLLDFQRLYNSYKFLLSFIGDECYNLDFLSGNIREIRTFKRFVRANSAVLSLIAILLLIFTVFRNPGMKDSN